MTVVGLPMYDLPELAAHTDALWAALAQALRETGVHDVPSTLTRGRTLDELWSDPNLLLAQSCGYPMMRDYAGRLVVVASPRYRARGCQGPTYRSLLVVRADSSATCLEDLRGTVCAFNSSHSHSGMNSLRALVAPLARAGRFFGEVRESGSHRRSLELIAEGAVDVAAIDCITHALVGQVRPEFLTSLRIVDETASAPAPPYVTRRDGPVEALRAAFSRVLRDPALIDTRRALLLDGVEILPDEQYAHFLQVETEAKSRGYAVLQ
jgi:ABC-type phosphate/phosphonate transport system substrate-binding protein